MARVISSIEDPETLGNHFLAFFNVSYLRLHRKGKNLIDGKDDFSLLNQQRGTILYLDTAK